MPGFVFTYGRFNPPTKGHGVLFRSIVDRANDIGAIPVIVVSHSNSSKKDPLTAEEKTDIIQTVFPGVLVLASGPGNQIGDIMKNLIAKYGLPGEMMLGSDRIEQGSFESMTKFYGINRIKAGKNRNLTDTGTDPLARISGTRARSAAVKRNLNAFRFQSIMGNDPDLKNRMNMLANRINILPAKTPPKPKTARLKSASVKQRRKGPPLP